MSPLGTRRGATMTLLFSRIIQQDPRTLFGIPEQ
jgi:hypothetical protein